MFARQSAKKLFNRTHRLLFVSGMRFSIETYLVLFSFDQLMKNGTTNARLSINSDSNLLIHSAEKEIRQQTVHSYKHFRNDVEQHQSNQTRRVANTYWMCTMRFNLVLKLDSMSSNAITFRNKFTSVLMSWYKPSSWTFKLPFKIYLVFWLHAVINKPTSSYLVQYQL